MAGTDEAAIAPEALLDCLADGVLVVIEGRVALASAGACEVLGRSKKALLGASIEGLLPPEAGQVVERVLEGAASCTVRGLRWGAVSGGLSITGTPGPDVGQVVLVVRGGGEPAGGAAARDFHRRLAWLQSLAAGMAHEIRNPLGSLRGAAQLLRRGPEAHEVDELCTLIIQEADRIHVQVERLMALTRPRPLQRRPVDLNRLVDEAVASARAAAPGLRFLRSLDPSLPEVEGDRDRLAEVLGNLLKNAAEAAGSEVRIHTGIDPHGRLVEPGFDRGATLQVVVEDDGPGIEEERMARLFTPFETTKAAGTGLGLFVARLAVDEHRGLLRVEGRPGEGARFTVVLSQRLPPGAGDGPEDPWSGRVPVREAGR